MKDEGSNADEDKYKSELGRWENAIVGQPQSFIQRWMVWLHGISSRWGRIT